MKKITLLTLMIFCALTFVKAQNKLGPITITHGQEITQDKEKIVRIAGEVNDKIYTLATKGKNFFIKVFNSSDMSLDSTNEIEMPDFIDKEPVFEDIFVVGESVYILGSVYDKKNKVSNLLAVEIDENGKLVNEKKKLFSTKVTKNKERGAFYFKNSPKEDAILIMHASLFDKEEVIQYEIKLFDKNLDIMMEHKEKVPFNDRKDLEFTISDFDVNVYDDVFLVINESYRNKKAKKNIEKFEVHLFKSDNSYSKEVVKIDITDKEIINCEALANRDGKLHLVGFYSSVRENGKANKELKGVYAAAINIDTKTTESIKFNEFDYDTKVKLLGERRAKKGKDVKPLYATHSLIEKNDGGLILMSEYQVVTIGKAQGFGPLSVQPIIHDNNEIIVSSLNPDGSIAWTNVIAKKQRAGFSVLSIGAFGFSGNSNFTVSAGISVPLGVLGKGPEYLSAMPIYENGQLTVVFNDNEKNIGVTDVEEIKSLGNYNKGLPTAFVFDNEGNIDRIDQKEYQEDQLILRPRVNYRKNPKEYIIYSSRKSVDKLGRMTIQ